MSRIFIWARYSLRRASRAVISLFSRKADLVFTMLFHLDFLKTFKFSKIAVSSSESVDPRFPVRAWWRSS